MYVLGLVLRVNDNPSCSLSSRSRGRGANNNVNPDSVCSCFKSIGTREVNLAEYMKNFTFSRTFFVRLYNDRFISTFPIISIKVYDIGDLLFSKPGVEPSCSRVPGYPEFFECERARGDSSMRRVFTPWKSDSTRAILCGDTWAITSSFPLLHSPQQSILRDRIQSVDILLGGTPERLTRVLRHR